MPRARLLHNLAAQIAAILPSLAQDELDGHSRFTADTIMLPGESPYREKEVFSCWLCHKLFNLDYNGREFRFCRPPV